MLELQITNNLSVYVEKYSDYILYVKLISRKEVSNCFGVTVIQENILERDHIPKEQLYDWLLSKSNY